MTPGGSGEGGLAGPGPEQPGGLTHLDDAGRARMVDVGAKDATDRTARASCRVLMTPRTAGLLASGDLPKGDAVGVARLAGIQAAKHTWELVPLCHQIALSSVDVDVQVDAVDGVVTISSVARARDRTGVEMEALTAASVAALALYDMVKAVERGVTITDLRLVSKTGGVRGDWSAGGDAEHGEPAQGATTG